MLSGVQGASFQGSIMATWTENQISSTHHPPMIHSLALSIFVRVTGSQSLMEEMNIQRLVPKALSSLAQDALRQPDQKEVVGIQVTYP